MLLLFLRFRGWSEELPTRREGEILDSSIRRFGDVVSIVGIPPITLFEDAPAVADDVSGVTLMFDIIAVVVVDEDDYFCRLMKFKGCEVYVNEDDEEVIARLFWGSSVWMWRKTDALGLMSYCYYKNYDYSDASFMF